MITLGCQTKSKNDRKEVVLPENITQTTVHEEEDSGELLKPIAEMKAVETNRMPKKKVPKNHVHTSGLEEVSL